MTVQSNIQPLRFLTREFDIFLGFSWRDWSTTIIPGSIFSIGAMRQGTHLHSNPLTLLANYTFLVFWLTPYIYFFNLSNQITGVDEDQINKPDRPIPSGKVTLAGAKVRWSAALAAFLGIALYETSILPETLCWIATVAFLCLTEAGNHWFGKNCVAMTAGTWALLSTSWKAIAPATSQSERYVVAIAVWSGLLTHIQDLRDIKGDTAVGRKTLPLVVGDGQCRFIITFAMVPLGLSVLWAGDVLQIAPALVVGVHAFLGWRIMHAKGPRYDHKTYMVIVSRFFGLMWKLNTPLQLYTYIFCLLLALTSVRDLKVNLSAIPATWKFSAKRSNVLAL
ncbi:hypothetical protein CVT26_013453 [Gymnopilus dilepis]|uniref:UbiA prenyltransferase n=1 Tax=Gymnopilus dilepis TaxID=231916 RepID=A0A409YWZ7_9AGAR|nr:hypothetical protein CVT26_013453 [Gymnopilus dilepis]